MIKFLILLLAVNIMAEQITPYPYPDYDEELLAKEIVNGSYNASIKMQIKNSRTGEERYVTFTSKPQVIDDAEVGKLAKEKVQNYDKNIRVYDRDKSLEDAVLPKYVDEPEKDPIIVSKAMCPQGLTYTGEMEIALGYLFGRYDDGTVSRAVFAQETDADGNMDDSGSYRTVFVLNGLEIKKLFTLPEGVSIAWFYSVGQRNFFYANYRVYEYTLSGYTELIKSTVSYPHNIVIRDENKFYILGGMTIELQDIDTGEVIKANFDDTVELETVFASAYKDNYFYKKTGGEYYVSNGEIKKVEKYKDWYRSSLRVRYDYHRGSGRTKYNLKYGIVAPRTKMPYITQGSTFPKEGYIVVSDGRIKYTRDYKNYIDSGISILALSATIVTTKDYVYVYDRTRLTVASIDEWSYKPRDGRYVELYSINGMVDRRFSTPYIGE